MHLSFRADRPGRILLRFESVEEPEVLFCAPDGVEFSNLGCRPRQYRPFSLEVSKVRAGIVGIDSFEICDDLGVAGRQVSVLHSRDAALIHADLGGDRRLSHPSRSSEVRKSPPNIIWNYQSHLR